MERLSNLVSDVVNPFVVFTALYVLVAFFYSDGASEAAIFVALELLAAGSVAAFVFWVKRRRRVGDFWISAREERVFPAIVLLGAFAGLLALLSVFDAPLEVFCLTLSMGLAAASVAAVTLLWKASAHAAVAGHAAAAGLLLLGWFGLPFAVLLPLVAWARVRGGAHTPAQVAVGAGIGGLFAFVFLG